MGAVLRAENLSFYYNKDKENEEKAVDGISLDIDRGEFVTIIGHNGSGKSTLARHFNGLLLPFEGKIVIDGLDTSIEENIWKVRQKVGMVFQNPDNQIVATTVEEDIAFGPENLGIPPNEIKVRINEALEMVGLEEQLGHAPHLLSGGQKQRLAIAGVIAMRPEVLVLDEPTAMLDPRGKREVLNTLKQLNENENITIVNITHFMDEALESNRVIVMNKGRIELDNTPDEIFSQVNNIKKLGLEVPQIVELAHSLREEGVNLSKNIFNIKKLVEEIC